MRKRRVAAKDVLPKEELVSVSGSSPHDSWEDWREVLESMPVLDTADGAVMLGEEDSMFIVFPNGCLHHTTGPYALAMMHEVRASGALNTLRSLKMSRMRIRKALDSIDANTTE